VIEENPANEQPNEGKKTIDKVAEDYFIPQEPGRFSETDLNLILEHSAKFDVSDITIQTGEPIIMEEYGKLRKLSRKSLSNAEAGDLLNSIYGANGTTRLLSGEDIDTNYEFKPDRANRLRFRVNATACMVDGHEGMQITLRTIPTDPPILSGLELEPDLIKALKPSEGVVYVTGATGSGKTTLLASIIRSIVEDPEEHRKILTYESPIEFVYDNIERHASIVSQTEIPKHLPSFAHGVRNALRRKPRLILVGESRDYETINAVLDAALTGHPVYTTVHSNGVAETARRLIGSFPRSERMGKTIDIIETLRLIIWQKLVPSTDGKQTALREYLVFTDKVRDALLSQDVDNITANIRKELKKSKTSMIDCAIKKHKAGIISDETFNKLKQMDQSANKDLGT
jgi:defect-in-organelle-trafficking protein DotB